MIGWCWISKESTGGGGGWVVVSAFTSVVSVPQCRLPHIGIPTHLSSSSSNKRSIAKRSAATGKNPRFVPMTAAPRLSRTAVAAASNHPVDNEEKHENTDATGASATATTTSTTITNPKYPKPVSVMAVSSGISIQSDLLESIREAVSVAVAGFPPNEGGNGGSIDLGLVFVSSLYDNESRHPPSVTVIPTILAVLAECNRSIQHLVGCSVAGAIGMPNIPTSSTTAKTPTLDVVTPVEAEGTVPTVSIVLMQLPDTQISTFHIQAADIPDENYSTNYNNNQDEWKNILPQSPTSSSPDAILLLPSPTFGSALDGFLKGLSNVLGNHPSATIFGGIASTVSSLSRAKLYRYSAGKSNNSGCFLDGCVGVVMTGDVQITSRIALGAKPVGGVYNILKARESTIHAIALDKEETERWFPKTDDDDFDSDMQAYSEKARIPKPPLAEANYLMKNVLSDDERSSMRRQILIGIRNAQSRWSTPSDVVRGSSSTQDSLPSSSYRIMAVASAGMKDGSVTLPLGSVDLGGKDSSASSWPSPFASKMRFFVRDSEFAKTEVEHLWTEYTKEILKRQFTEPSTDQDESSSFVTSPACCFLFPTLDRGAKFFTGTTTKAGTGFESATAARRLPPGIPVTGFFSNAVIGPFFVAGGVTKNMNNNTNDPMASTQGSASGYFWLTSKSGRPVYSKMAEKAEPADIEASSEERINDPTEVLSTLRKDGAAPFGQAKQRAPRSPNGELMWKRREVHSGRAISVSTVEWSVAEKTAQPTSVLEGFVWEKEYEVDRHRERVPLVNLVSQCRQAAADPGSPKPRDWIKAIRQKSASGSFVIVPEFKRSDPAYEGGASLRRRYDFPSLASDFVSAGATAVSVNCDAILFGGAMDHVSQVRQALTQAALESSTAQEGVVVPPILASDLILYPYQLYRLRLAGADAVNLAAGALDGKDLVYLTKIAAGLQLQVLVTVTTQVQIQVLAESVAPKVGTILNGVIVSNRQLEDYSFDETGKQALLLLKSVAMQNLREAVSDDFVVLAEGGVGIIERTDEITGESDPSNYVRELAQAGAVGAIVGAGLAAADISVPETVKKLQNAT